ncbi:MAG TPA: CAP domain-containing protein [Candidatus Paceibacterota bacterium]|nr:CAP domain-containing protein [Candidatus Paceibacterota bacterium]
METPHHERHPARHVLGTAGLIALTLAAVATLGAATFYARTYLTSTQMAAVISAVLVDLANDDRTDAALPALTVNPKLVAAAQAKADDMAAKSYFAHTSPDGTTSWQWFKDAGYAYASAGENLAVDFNDSENVERAWMDSPTHRANILSGKFTEIGIATAVGELDGKRTVFVVQMFGRPAASPLPVPVAAVTPPAPEEIAIAADEPDDVLGSTDEAPHAALIEDEGLAAAVEGVAAPTAPEEAVAPAAESGMPLVAPVAARHAPVWGLVAASPERALRGIYIAFAFLLLGALLMITRVEFRKHHFRHVAAASIALVMLGGLFFVADTFVFPAPAIGQAVASSNG